MIAFIFIVVCHIQQYLGCELAWWFNIGVQIFLCISGYLYGQRKIENGIAFLKKQFKKILFPYYIVIVPIIVIQLIFFGQEITIIQAVRALLCNATLNGGNHLWFIPTILMCYFITPFLEEYFNYERHHFVSAFIKMICIFGIVFGAFIRYFNPAWMTCYLFGFVMGTMVKLKFESIKRCVEKVVIVLALLNVVQIYIDYVIDVEFQGLIGSIYNYWCNYNHVWLGVIFFVFARCFFNRKQLCQHKKLINILKISDRYSYEGYLVHHFMILGPMSLMALTGNIIFNISIIIILIAGLSFIIQKITTWLFAIENKVLKGVFG